MSGQRVLDIGTIANLSSDEWLQRWKILRARRPGYPEVSAALNAPPVIRSPATIRAGE